MTADLYPTPTRLQLLADVLAGLVWRDPQDGQAYIGSTTPKRKPPKVTAAVDELVRAGWIAKRSETSAVYELTDAGRVILDRRSLS